jgi:uncharacterized membrane protein YgdD (TMEM256/DUF423 family)
MHKSFLVTGSALAAMAVALGAFGAHGLKTIADAETVQVFQTGVQYQMYHALALLAVALVFEKFQNRVVKWAGFLFLAGIILFSGSLYLLTFLKTAESALAKYVGPVTPIGGMLFMAGWLFLLAGVFRKKK